MSGAFATGGWSFTSDVVNVFDEHVAASVPHYELFQSIVARIADWLLPAGGLFADIGASTGTTARAVLRRHPDRRLRVVLYDRERAMLDKAKAKIGNFAAEAKFFPSNLPLGGLQHYDADLTVSLFTLQFLPIKDRQTVLMQARHRSAPSGALLVAEKIRPVDSRWSEIARDMTHEWKSERGLAATAILAKQRALRGVLVPHPSQTLTDLISEAGWVSPEVLFRWHEWQLVGAFASDRGL